MKVETNKGEERIIKELWLISEKGDTIFNSQSEHLVIVNAFCQFLRKLQEDGIHIVLIAFNIYLILTTLEIAMRRQHQEYQQLLNSRVMYLSDLEWC